MYFAIYKGETAAVTSSMRICHDNSEEVVRVGKIYQQCLRDPIHSFRSGPSEAPKEEREGGATGESSYQLNCEMPPN
jgi:hypothetical protein